MAVHCTCVVILRNNLDQVDSLHAVMSDKEYSVIVDCTCMNLSEEPRLPPSFHGSKEDPKDTMRMLADKVNMNSQILLSQTVNIVAVDVGYALLELCNGVHESPLAHLAVSLFVYQRYKCPHTCIYICDNSSFYAWFILYKH